MGEAPDLAWPRPRLSETRIARLSEEAGVAALNPLMAMVAMTKLLACGAHFSHAKKLIRLVESEPGAADTDTGVFSSVVAAAILAHDLDLALTMLRRRFGISRPLAIEPGPLDQKVDVAIFRSKNDSAAFLLSPALFDFDQGDMVLGRFAAVFPMFEAFMASPYRVDGEAAINLLDEGSVPGIAFCDYRPGYFLIPDPHYMLNDQYSYWRQAFRAQDIPWEARTPIAYWRGTTSGKQANPEIGWRSLPRVRLCEIAAENPGLIDAGITAVTQIQDPEAQNVLTERNYMRRRVSPLLYQTFRYQIDIDGNSNAWDGLVQRLLTGGPVLKVASPLGYEQWYYPRLRPWFNFVPVATDMSDLLEKVAWLRAHDDVARQIGAAGRDLAESLDRREIAKAGPSIAAAIRAGEDAPLIDLRVRSGTGDILRDGWSAPGTNGAAALGRESTLSLTRPIGLCDHALLLDVSAPGATSLEMAIDANGKTIGHFAIAQRATLYAPLPRSIVATEEALNLAIRFPAAANAEAGTDAAPPPGLLLHRIGIAAGTPDSLAGYPDLTALLASLNRDRLSAEIPPPTDWLDEASAAALPPRAEARAVRTWFGTILFADLETGRVRHGVDGEVPRNLFHVRLGDVSLLYRSADDGGFVPIVLCPQGPHARPDAWTPWNAGGLVRTFRRVALDDAGSKTFALRGAGLFTCAEVDGGFTLSRLRASQWETLRLDP